MENMFPKRWRTVLFQLFLGWFSTGKMVFLWYSYGIPMVLGGWYPMVFGHQIHDEDVGRHGADFKWNPWIMLRWFSVWSWENPWKVYGKSLGKSWENQVSLENWYKFVRMIHMAQSLVVTCRLTVRPWKWSLKLRLWKNQRHLQMSNHLHSIPKEAWGDWLGHAGDGTRAAVSCWWTNPAGRWTEDSRMCNSCGWIEPFSRKKSSKCANKSNYWKIHEHSIFLFHNSSI